jgi:hypothetical protein
MKKKQTAVQWLEFEINRRGPKEDNPPQWLKELYEQAKAMEKEQIINAYNRGTINGIDYPESSFPLTGEEYYNKTFQP